MDKKRILRAAALILLLAAYLILQLTRTAVPTADYDLKLAASQRAQDCFQAIAQLKTDLGLETDPSADINATGLIGLEYSFITTTIGNLEAKRTSTNPNMAAVVVDMFTELGLQPGDRVAVNCSGSFPALNTAVLCAIDVMELEPYLISSFGASTHGANDPSLTWLDMEHHLYSQGLIGHKSDLFSIGGMAIQISSVVGAALASFGLVLVGFDPAAVTPEGIAGLKGLYIYGMGGLSLVSAFLFLLYPLTEKYMEELRAKNAAKAE